MYGEEGKEEEYRVEGRRTRRDGGETSDREEETRERKE